MTETHPTTDLGTGFAAFCRARLWLQFKSRWVAALRSGKYTQGRVALRSTGNAFCCLGVACDLIDTSKWATVPRDLFDIQGLDWGSCKAQMADELLAAAIGIPEDEVRYLASMNDMRKPFEWIADYIEANL